MKFTKTEKIWLASVVFFYLLYNMPFLPGYENPAGTLIHAVFSLIPLWVSVYVGLFKVAGSYAPKEEKNQTVEKTESETTEAEEGRTC